MPWSSLFLSLTEYNFRLFTIVSDMGSQKRSLLLLLNLSRCLLDCAHQQLLSLSNLGAEVLLGGEQFLEANELFVNEHAGDAADKVREQLFDDGIDGITNEISSFFGSLELLKLGNVNLRKRKKGLLLLLSILAVISLRVISVATSSTSTTAVAASLVVVTVVGVTLLISTLVAIVLIAVAALVLIVSGDTHECGDNLLGLSVLLALPLLFFLFLGHPHLDSDGLGGS